MMKMKIEKSKGAALGKHFRTFAQWVLHCLLWGLFEKLSNPGTVAFLFLVLLLIVIEGSNINFSFF